MQRSQGLCSECCPGCTGNPFVPYRCSSKANTEEPGGHIRAGATKTSPEVFSVHPIISPGCTAGAEGAPGQGGSWAHSSPEVPKSRPGTGLVQGTAPSQGNALSWLGTPAGGRGQLRISCSAPAALPGKPSVCHTVPQLGQPGQGWGGSGGPWGGRALCLCTSSL